MRKALELFQLSAAQGYAPVMLNLAASISLVISAAE